MKKQNKLHMVQLIENFGDYGLRLFYEQMDNNNRFVGYLENIGNNSLYFTPEDGNGLIIIPHNWILWCVPMKENKEASA